MSFWNCLDFCVGYRFLLLVANNHPFLWLGKETDAVWGATTYKLVLRYSSGLFLIVLSATSFQIMFMPLVAKSKG